MVTLAPSSKGKARAEHRARQLTTKKKAKVRVRLAQQEIIERYNQDHQDSWGTQSEGTQEKFIDSIVDWGASLSAWDAPSDTESEQSYAEVMSQPGNSERNTPTPGRSTLPTAPTPTLANLTRVVMDLGITVGHITNQLNNLTQQVTLATSTCPRAAKAAVAHLKAWNGKGGSVKARHFLATFANYAGNEGDILMNWDPIGSVWIQNDKQWIAAVFNLMEEEVRTWVLPYPELLAFQGDYNNFVQAFLKRFAPLNTTEAAQDVLKALKQGKNSVAEYISRFDQYTGQTGWSEANHCTRFYNGLNEQLKDNLDISDHLIIHLTELKTTAQVCDQRMRQHEEEKKGHKYTLMSQAPFKDPNAMEVDASRQKEEHNRCTYMAFMKGKCYRCSSTDHAKRDRKHEQDICGHCKKVGHHSPICFSKYLGKPIAAKAAALPETPQASSSGGKGKATASATQNALAIDSKGQADLLSKLMAQVQVQSQELAALKSSF